MVYFMPHFTDKDAQALRDLSNFQDHTADQCTSLTYDFLAPKFTDLYVFLKSQKQTHFWNCLKLVNCLRIQKSSNRSEGFQTHCAYCHMYTQLDPNWGCHSKDRLHVFTQWVTGKSHHPDPSRTFGKAQTVPERHVFSFLFSNSREKETAGGLATYPGVSGFIKVKIPTSSGPSCHPTCHYTIYVYVDIDRLIFMYILFFFKIYLYHVYMYFVLL